MKMNKLINHKCIVIKKKLLQKKQKGYRKLKEMYFILFTYFLSLTRQAHNRSLYNGC